MGQLRGGIADKLKGERALVQPPLHLQLVSATSQSPGLQHYCGRGASILPRERHRHRGGQSRDGGVNKPFAGASLLDEESGMGVVGLSPFRLLEGVVCAGWELCELEVQRALRPSCSVLMLGLPGSGAGVTTLFNCWMTARPLCARPQSCPLVQCCLLPCCVYCPPALLLKPVTPIPLHPPLPRSHWPDRTRRTRSPLPAERPLNADSLGDPLGLGPQQAFFSSLLTGL
ncbi:hypothetical protein WMY93_028770 [Mugilogobius chulae]|uniref:Uncharacterized protein n=1 Tax=Mugilogobius chulae TaxID=88201 RepID=A0AAW0N118_9GOBI